MGTNRMPAWNGRMCRAGRFYYRVEQADRVIDALRNQIARLQAELAHWETFGVAPAPNVPFPESPEAIRPAMGSGDGKAGGDHEGGEQ